MQARGCTRPVPDRRDIAPSTRRYTRGWIVVMGRGIWDSLAGPHYSIAQSAERNAGRREMTLSPPKPSHRGRRPCGIDRPKELFATLRRGGRIGLHSAGVGCEGGDVAVDLFEEIRVPFHLLRQGRILIHQGLDVIGVVLGVYGDLR